MLRGNFVDSVSLYGTRCLQGNTAGQIFPVLNSQITACLPCSHAKGSRALEYFLRTRRVPRQPQTKVAARPANWKVGSARRFSVLSEGLANHFDISIQDTRGG